MERSELKENIILVNADYADTVAKNIGFHFEEQLGRSILPCSLADWLITCALDAGFEPNSQTEIQVIMIHSPRKKQLTSFAPSVFEKELDGQAFREEGLGEFLISCIRDEDVNKGAPLMEQCIQTVISDKGVKKLAVVTESLDNIEISKQEKAVSLISMTPTNKADVQHINMGFGLLHAMGIKPEDLE